jgi:two-component system cell cycle response regulator
MRILIADDSLMSRRLLESTLRSWGYEVISACDGKQAWQILDGEEAPPIAILDWMMPGYTGPDLCRLVRRKSAEPYTYILLLTSRNDKEDVVAGMDSGADDYLTKPFDKHELQVRLRAGTRIVDLQEQLLATREALRLQATRDYLTQLWNRSAILEILDRELARSEREGSPVGVIVADLDYFKHINDTYGHFAGDAALKEASLRMQASIRPYDAVGRYGGEEFLIVLARAGEESIVSQSERIRMAVESVPVNFNNSSFSISCSLGCATGVGGQVTADQLIHAADEALYTAKRTGRNRTVAAGPIVSVAAAIAGLSVAGDLKLA